MARAAVAAGAEEEDFMLTCGSELKDCVAFPRQGTREAIDRRHLDLSSLIATIQSMIPKRTEAESERNIKK